MKTKHTLVFTLITFIMFTFVSNSFAEVHKPTVRLIYFIPTDQTYNPKLENKLRRLIKQVQDFYGDEMKRHLGVRKTFELETNKSGDIVVHKVEGKFDTKTYMFGRDVGDEVHETYKEKFDKKHFYCFLIEHGDQKLPPGRGAAGSAYNVNPPIGGNAEIFAQSLTFYVLAHELGHAFSLPHDWRNNNYIMSYGGHNRDSLSKCAAKWLEVHRAFNPPAAIAADAPKEIAMHPPSLEKLPNFVRLVFDISDADGIHQIQLLGSTVLQNGYRGLIACKNISGSPSSKITFIVEATQQTKSFLLQVIDVNGDFKSYTYDISYENYFTINIEALLAEGNPVLIPDLLLAAEIRNKLDLEPDSKITRWHMGRIVELTLNNKGITNLIGLEHAKNLEKLSLIDNQIRHVRALSGLVKLKELRLEGNPIKIKDRKPLLVLLRKNPDVKIYLKDGGEPLPVTLSHFRAEYIDAGVLIKWITESEIDNAGFYLYRCGTKDGEFKVVNPAMIQGTGTTSERNTYTWTDTTAKPNTVYYYRIEDVSQAGVRKQLATVRLRGLVSAEGKMIIRWADLKTKLISK